MAVSTQVRVHSGSTWSEVSRVSDIRLRRKVGAGEASFRVNDASLALKNLLRTGRECEITITVGDQHKVFGGFIDRPEIEAEAPGHFNLLVRVVDLSHGAGWQRVVPAVAASGTKYTDMLKQFWAASWDVVDTASGGVADNDLTHAETYRPGHDYLASVTDDIVKRFLPNWHWWVSHNGTSSSGISKKLNVQPRGHVDKTGWITITESDIGPRFRVRPTVDPRNYITVCGDDDPDTASERPVSRIVTDTNSQGAYGVRHLVTKEGSVFDGGALSNICNSLLEQRRWDYLQGRFRIPDWSIEPGDNVNMYLPTIGSNDGNSGVPWVLIEVEEQVNQGSAERFGTFIEHSDAAFSRVT